MANPVTNPPVWVDGVGPYTVTNSDFIAADILLQDIDDSATEIVLTIPAGGTVNLIRNPANWTAAGTPILSAGAWIANPPALGDWNVSVVAGGNAAAPATVTIASNTSGASGLLRVIVTGIGIQPASIEGSAGTFSINRVLAAPSLVSAAVTSGTPVRERAAVTLTATTAQSVVMNPAPVPPLSPPPNIVSKWTENPANSLALTDFTSLGATATFTAPGVYQPETLNFTASATLDLNGNGLVNIGEPATSQVLNVPIETVRYGLVLVVDRSGSMAGTLGGGISKWNAAVQAAHGWTDLFRAFRPQANHLAGVVTFEHGGCSWTATPPSDITFRNPSNAMPAAGLTALSGMGNVNTWNLGTEQSCTPIGEALVEAWQGIGTALGASDAGAVILLTDGYENSGNVKIGNTPTAGATNFASRRTQPDLSAANALIGPRLYTIGVGTSVDEDVLNLLGNSYRLITNSVDEVKPAFAAMLGLVVDAQALMASAVSPGNADGSPAPDKANAFYYPVSTKEQVLVFMVRWSAITDKLRLAKRAQGGAGAYTFVNPGDPGVTLIQRGTHGLIRVDLRAHFPGVPSPATDWRLQHTDSGNLARPLPVLPALPDSNALAMVDLVTKAEVSFDQKQYFIGQTIKLMCKIRTGGTRVTDATVLVDCARPGEGLGTFLTLNAKRQTRPATSKSGDPLSGKGLMYKSLLAAMDKEDLPIVTTPDFELFDDGAHGDGDASDGDFANVYADTDKEGTYTFRFRVEGTLPDGSRFSRIFVKSTWVGVLPDPDLLGMVWTNVGMVGTSMVSMATLKPQTRTGEYLGPYRTAEITLVAHGGTLDGDLIDNHDGSYSQKVIHDRDTDPVLSTTIYGVPMTPAGPAFDPPGSPRDCCKLYHRAFRCTINGVKRLLFGK